MSRIPIVVTALAATALTAAGCGGSSASAPSSASSPVSPKQALTRTQLIEQVNMICAHLNARRSSTQFTNPQASARFAHGLSVYERSAAAELTRLVSPPALASVVSQIASSTEDLARDTSKLGEYAKSGSSTPAADKLFRSMQASHHVIFVIARDHGFVECTKSS